MLANLGWRESRNHSNAAGYAAHTASHSSNAPLIFLSLLTPGNYGRMFNPASAVPSLLR
jgi:hypothetical protein